MHYFKKIEKHYINRVEATDGRTFYRFAPDCWEQLVPETHSVKPVAQEELEILEEAFCREILEAPDMIVLDPIKLDVNSVPDASISSEIYAHVAILSNLYLLKLMYLQMFRDDKAWKILVPASAAIVKSLNRILPSHKEAAHVVARCDAAAKSTYPKLAAKELELEEAKRKMKEAR